jgi:SAM-dependent methyltransferase
VPAEHIDWSRPSRRTGVFCGFGNEFCQKVARAGTFVTGREPRPDRSVRWFRLRRSRQFSALHRTEDAKTGEQMRADNAQYWDELYQSSEQLFSGNPNGALVAEVGDMPPGQALDVGCGEGGDALWLARKGWQVTAVDISRTALERAAAAGTDVADRVAWTRTDLTVAPPPAGAFDLVSVQYFPLPRRPEHTALRRLLEAVTPGGTLLFVSHDLADFPSDHEHSLDPADYYQPKEVATLLGDDWTIQIDETRPRTAPAPPGTHHVHDVVLRAQRLR